MGKFIDETGKHHGRFTVIKEAGKDKGGEALWLCQCDCGNIRIVVGFNLRSGHSKSCGCYQKEVTSKTNTIHGCSQKRIYCIWRNMKDRCLNKKDPAYKNYGGRGITVCEKWLRFVPFYEWAMNHGYRKDLTIERTNNEKGYSSDNCIFATRQEQAFNQRINKNNKTGCAGVRWYKQSRKYQVYIGTNREQIHLGYFTNIQDAITARKVAELKYWGKSDLGVEEK